MSGSTSAVFPNTSAAHVSAHGKFGSRAAASLGSIHTNQTGTGAETRDATGRERGQVHAGIDCRQPPAPRRS